MYYPLEDAGGANRSDLKFFKFPLSFIANFYIDDIKLNMLILEVIFWRLQ